MPIRGSALELSLGPKLLPGLFLSSRKSVSMPQGEMARLAVSVRVAILPFPTLTVAERPCVNSALTFEGA